MQHVFLFVKKPSAQELRVPGRMIVLQDFGHEIDRIREQNKQIENLCENAWQIPLQNGLPSLSEMILAAQTAGLAYRALLVDGEPNWLT